LTKGIAELFFWYLCVQGKPRWDGGAVLPFSGIFHAPQKCWGKPLAILLCWGVVWAWVACWLLEKRAWLFGTGVSRWLFGTGVSRWLLAIWAFGLGFFVLVLLLSFLRFGLACSLAYQFCFVNFL
jgi:hypothetical protein